ncbi:asparagine synthase-related protein [Cognatiluteimonas profundi]|uniref:asparagine synthase-related protein n=1 Tax=Cognatiluteimonas profundi TaxID=2594501 RepID=UPI00131EA2C1|nr:asparagine synthase-related protein [Lysobacter profundi]
MHVNLSPYHGKPDFSRLAGKLAGDIDLVSVADILRNSIVFAPHSTLEGVKQLPLGFTPQQEMDSAPEFHFDFRHQGQSKAVDGGQQDWVGNYHRLLCEATARACEGMQSPWLLQSGGKDSTTLAIALAESRPDTTCITYLGGTEENEVASATHVAATLGLRHEQLVCDPGRAYDRYLDLIDRMPLLSADFALLSYVDLATEIARNGGDGVIDGLGSDNYFGTPVKLQQRMLFWLARGIRLPPSIFELPLVRRNFKLCYALSTLQMRAVERVFPGSRFTDDEVDALFGRQVAQESRARLGLFEPELASASSLDEWRDISLSIAAATGGFGKGIYTTNALSMQIAFPFCDRQFRDWVYDEVPLDKKVDPATRLSKVLVREHISTRFGELPYVAAKGSFRFSLCGLASARFDQVHAFARQASDVLPGAARWLERNRSLLDNKYHASKFYLLAIVLPWIVEHTHKPETA